MLTLRSAYAPGALLFAALAAACTHDLDTFRPGTVSPDSSVASDAAQDATLDTEDGAVAEDAASEVFEEGGSDAGDSGIDSLQEDTGVATDADATVVDTEQTIDVADALTEDAQDAEDSGDTRDTMPEPDTGPPVVEPGCFGAAGGPTAICIPETTFGLGAANGTACTTADGGVGCPSELPKVTVKVSTFYIDDNEVTVGRFRAWFMKGTARTWPAVNATFYARGSKAYKWRAGWPTAPSEPVKNLANPTCTWKGEADATNDALALNCVDWYTALGFCMSELEGNVRRLPTEAEWEAEASGGGDRLFPWSGANTEDSAYVGSDIDCLEAFAQNGCGSPTSPPSFAASSTIFGRSRHGAWNMAGGLAEWMLDGFLASWAGVATNTVDPINDPGATPSVLARGGHWASPARELRAAARPPTATGGANTTTTTIGFRCAK